MRKNKFNARRTNGYDSRKESRRAEELKLLAAAGNISNLEEQTKLTLMDSFTDNFGRKHRAITYKPDFVYFDIEQGIWIAEDVKSKATKTPAFSIRFKLAQKLYPDYKFITT